MLMLGGVTIGKIVQSDSHVRYTCQIFGPGEVSAPPEPADYAFGSFVRVPLRVSPARADVALLMPQGPHLANTPPADALVPAAPPLTGGGESAHWAIGLIYDTLLVNPAFGTLGPRLSNDDQVELFSPDYLSERAVLVSILLLGMMTLPPHGTPRVAHGVPPLAPDLGGAVVSLTESEQQQFHFFADESVPGAGEPYLHMGYLPHAIAQDNALLPMAMLRTIERLETLFPANARLLSIVKRNFAWRLKVETAG